MASSGGGGISIFGNKNRKYNFFSSTVIRRIENDSGKLSSHFELVQNTIKIGLNPIYMKEGTPYKLYTHDGKIFTDILHDVSAEILSKDNYLICFYPGHYYINDFSFFSFSPEKGGDFSSFDWFPRSTFLNWQNECTATYFFDDENSGFVRASDGHVVGLKNQNSRALKHNAWCRDSDYFVSRLPDDEVDKYTLNVRNAVFTIKNIDFGTFSNEVAIFTVGFKFERPPKKKQLLISSPCLIRSVYILGKKVYVKGSENDDTIKDNLYLGEYNFLFLLYDQQGSGLLQVNDSVQHFKTKHVQRSKQEIYLFGKSDTKISCFNGQISMAHIFLKKGLPRSGFPPQLRQTIYREYTSRIS